MYRIVNENPAVMTHESNDLLSLTLILKELHDERKKCAVGGWFITHVSCISFTKQTMWHAF